MKRLVPAVALALVVGATQPGCPCTAAGALIGLIVGAVNDDPFPDRNDRVRAHVRNGVEIGFKMDVCLLAAFLESGYASRETEADGTALALLNLGNPDAEGPSKTQIIIGPTSCTLAYRF